MKRPFSSNPFNKKKSDKLPKLRIPSAINNFNENKQKFDNFSKERPKTSMQEINNMNIFSKNTDEKLDVLNLIIESNPNQYNSQKIEKKIKEINPLFIKGTEENLQRPHFNQNTEEVFYKYNLLYGNNTTNIIRNYSPKMRPMSASINGFNKKMTQDLNENLYVFNEDEILELIKARCQDIGIDLRENMIYKFKDYCNSKCKNRVVDLSECYLGIHSINFLSKILYNSSRISRLNLTKNNLGDNGVSILINSIKNSLSLISLNITSNCITHKGGEVIFKDLCYQQSIIDFNVSSIEGTNRNRLTAFGIKDIEMYLKKNLFVESLNICGNSIKDEGFILLCKGLENNQRLLNLNIANNDIHSKGIKQGLSLITTTKLYFLNISNNPILDEGLICLTENLKHFQNLHKLNISNCSFEFKGFQFLLNVLQYTKRIEYLNVSGNKLKNRMFELVRPCFSTFGVRYLNMSKCSLGNESTYVLGECISSNETIKNLNISENKISDAGFKSFVNLFQSNNVMESFDASVNFISDLTAKDFIKNLKFNHTLKKINFFDNQLKPEIGSLFIEILESNKTLVSINLIYNRIQMKTIDEINRILKANSEKQKSKFVPNLLRNIKNLQFNPESFEFYVQNIKNKKRQQEILYKKVKEDDRNFTALIKKEDKKINKKISEMESITLQISEYDNKIKSIKENIDKLQLSIREHEEIMEEKMNEAKLELKVIKDKNNAMTSDYMQIKNDLEAVVEGTFEKHTRVKNKLEIANGSFQKMTQRLKLKTEHYENLMNPEMLVPIESKEKKEMNDIKENKEIFSKSPGKNTKNLMKKKNASRKNSIVFNASSELKGILNINTTNENVVTTVSSTNNNDNKKGVRGSIKTIPGK